MTIKEILSDYPRWCMCDQDECQDSQNFKEAITKLELMQNKARYEELAKLVTKYNRSRKVFLDHYEERYKYLKGKLDDNN